MTTTVDAIYEHGKLVLPRPLSLPEKSRVRVTIETTDVVPADLTGDFARLSEPAFRAIWDNPLDADYDHL